MTEQSSRHRYSSIFTQKHCCDQTTKQHPSSLTCVQPNKSNAVIRWQSNTPAHSLAHFVRVLPVRVVLDVLVLNPASIHIQMKVGIHADKSGHSHRQGWTHTHRRGWAYKWGWRYMDEGGHSHRRGWTHAHRRGWAYKWGWRYMDEGGHIHLFALHSLNSEAKKALSRR